MIATKFYTLSIGNISSLSVCETVTENGYLTTKHLQQIQNLERIQETFSDHIKTKDKNFSNSCVTLVLASIFAVFPLFVIPGHNKIVFTYTLEFTYGNVT